MTKIVSVERMRRIEVAADAAGVSYADLMENAGRAVAEVAREMLGLHTEGARIAVLIGHGNNGGDGLVAARILKLETQAEVGCYLAKPRGDDDPNFVAARDAGVFIASSDEDQRWRVLHNLVSNADILIDALLGTGARLPIEGNLKKLMTEVAASLHRRRVVSEHQPDLYWASSPRRVDASGTRVLAVDCPSGLDCDTGQIDRLAIRADVSVTFAAAKYGQLAFPGAHSIGELVVAPIGIPETLPELQAADSELLTGEAVAAMLPVRSRDSHKGSYGKSMVIAGTVNYTGAPILAATAAYRAGAGLVRLAVPQAIYPMAAAQIPEAIWSLLPHEMGAINAAAVDVVLEDIAGIDAVLVGPGLGQDEVTAEFMRGLFGGRRHPQKGHIGFGPSQGTGNAPEQAGLTMPIVIDADGLNLLAKSDGWPSMLPPSTILTPHVGEMSRLSGLTMEAIQADRIALARAKAIEWNCVLVLKGAFTVAASPDGRVMVSPFATDALATAGTGDVLAGCILGLLAQGAPPFEAASASAYLHGLAGALCAQKQAARSTMASDVLNALPGAIRHVEALGAE